MAAEHRPQIRGDGEPAAVVGAVEADDVPVVGEPGGRQVLAIVSGGLGGVDRQVEAPLGETETGGGDAYNDGECRVLTRRCATN